MKASKSLPFVPPPPRKAPIDDDQTGVQDVNAGYASVLSSFKRALDGLHRGVDDSIALFNTDLEAQMSTTGTTGKLWAEHMEMVALATAAEAKQKNAENAARSEAIDGEVEEDEMEVGLRKLEAQAEEVTLQYE